MIVTLFFALINWSYADWVLWGVATHCDPNGKTFTLAPVVEVSQPDPGEIEVLPGFKQLEYGDHSIRCLVSDIAVSAKISVYPPSNGQCMGAGFVKIENLYVGQAKALPLRQAFNWSCVPPVKTLTKVSVLSAQDGIMVETCEAKNWEWGEGYVDNRCMKKPIHPYEPSFDCNKAKTEIEHIICNNRQLSSLDKTLAELYEKALKTSEDPSALRNAQRDWLRKQRDACDDIACIDKSYRQRIRGLAGTASNSSGNK